jgi:hypothetical protein
MLPYDGIRSSQGSIAEISSMRIRVEGRRGEEPIARFLQAIGDGAMLESPLAQESLAARLDLPAAFRVDHVVVVSTDLLVQSLGRARQEIAMLVNLMPTSA